jgi:hypothetical protein
MKIGEKNIGTTDRIIRIIVGIAILAAAVLNLVAAPWTYLGAVIGIVVIGTGIFQTCLLYSILGISTVEKGRL